MIQRRVVYIGNFAPEHSTESNVRDTLRDMGHKVYEVQEDGQFVGDQARQALDFGPDLLLYTRTWGFGGSHQLLDIYRLAGVPTATVHLDLFFGTHREGLVHGDAAFRCLPGSTVVEAASVAGVTRRMYSGELVRVRAGEHELAATPNHPVLTRRGWVPIGEVREGDDLICDDRLETTKPGAPEVDHGEATIEQVFDASRLAVGRRGALAPSCQRIAGLMVDFHGDGSEADIEVVRPNDGLLFDVLPSFAQPTGDLTLLLTEARGVHRAEPRPELFAVTGSGQNGSLGVAAERDARIDQDPTDCTRPARREPQRRFNRRPGFASMVPLHDFVGDGRAPGGSGTDAPGPFGSENSSVLTEPLPDVADGPAGAVGELLTAFAGSVSTAKVVHVEREMFSGHVYNLVTDEGAYLAQGIVTHNCDHVFTADGGHENDFALAGVNHHFLPPAILKSSCYLAETWDPRDTTDVLFVGCPQPPYHPEWPWRGELLDALRKHYGGRFSHRGATRDDTIRGHKLNELYAGAKVVVGDSLMLAPLYWSDRIPETLGRGGILTTTCTDFETTFPAMQASVGPTCPTSAFIPEVKAAIDSVDYLLALPDDVRSEMRARAVENVREHGSYHARMDTVLTTIFGADRDGPRLLVEDPALEW